MATVVVVGEVVVDRFVRDGATTDVAGGSAANTALAMSMAGHKATLRARFSIDAAGRFLREHAEDLGLDLTGSIDAPEPATVVTVTLDGGLPTYDFAMAGTADWQWTPAEIDSPLPEGCQAVSFGSLAAVMEPGSQALLDWAGQVRRQGVLVAYDPNARPTAVPADEADTVRARILSWVAAADVVKVSDEDLEWIAPGTEALDTAVHWSTVGPRLVVLTGGGAGAWACIDGRVIAHCQAPSIEVVDTVGAGDTLMGWLVAGLVDTSAVDQPERIAQVLQQAVTAAALTCTRQGCQPPTTAEVDALG